MNWEGLRKKNPDSWILFEAAKAHSNRGKRIIDDLSILDTFNESNEAIKAYRKLHKSEPSRELYVAHTAKENLEIQERKLLGVRV